MSNQGFAFWQTQIHPEDQELLIGGEPYSRTHSATNAQRGEHLTPEGLAPFILETLAAAGDLPFNKLPAAQPQPKEANKMSVLKTFCFNATREQIVALFADETVALETLQMCAFVALGGSPAELGAMPSAAPAVLAPNGQKRRGRPPGVPRAPETNNGDGDNPIDAVVKALASSGVGFAVADVVAGAGNNISKAQAAGAIKRAMLQGVLKNHGDRRWSRYGATAAIAKAASQAARGK